MEPIRKTLTGFTHRKRLSRIVQVVDRNDFPTYSRVWLCRRIRLKKVFSQFNHPIRSLQIRPLPILSPHDRGSESVSHSIRIRLTAQFAINLLKRSSCFLFSCPLTQFKRCVNADQGIVSRFRNNEFQVSDWLWILSLPESVDVEVLVDVHAMSHSRRLTTLATPED